MRIILCGPYLNEKMEMLLPEASPAAGKFLRNVKKGLTAAGCEVIVFSYQSIPVPDSSIADLEKEIIVSESENEFYVFKNKNTALAVLEYRKKILNSIGKGDIVLFYNSIYPTLFMQKKIHALGASVILILADFTEPEEYRSLVRKTLAHMCKIDMKKYDSYVLLSIGYMKSLGNKDNRILVQGGIDEAILGRFSIPKLNGILTYYYSGLLSEENGVLNMVEAFEAIENADIRLVISGKGSLEHYIRKKCSQDRRITYIGYVNNEQYYKLLENAHILINPRNMEIPQNKNNFPSKIMEYLASGRMIISTKFPSWQTFEGEIHYCDSNTDSICSAMIAVNESYNSEYLNVFNKNTEVAKHYSWQSQAKRIKDLCVRLKI